MNNSTSNNDRDPNKHIKNFSDDKPLKFTLPSRPEDEGAVTEEKLNNLLDEKGWAFMFDYIIENQLKSEDIRPNDSSVRPEDGPSVDMFERATKLKSSLEWFLKASKLKAYLVHNSSIDINNGSVVRSYKEVVPGDIIEECISRYEKNGLNEFYYAFGGFALENAGCSREDVKLAAEESSGVYKTMTVGKENKSNRDWFRRKLDRHIKDQMEETIPLPVDL